MPSNFAITSKPFLHIENSNNKAVQIIQMNEYSSRNLPLAIKRKIKNINTKAVAIAMICSLYGMTFSIKF